MSPPRRSTITEADDAFGTNQEARDNGCQAQQDQDDGAPSERHHHHDRYDRKNQRIRDHLRRWKSLRGQRRRKKDRADFKGQQDGQCRVPKPILPRLDQSSPVAEGIGARETLHTMTGFFAAMHAALRFRRPQG
jgi:hypothetical protein